MNDDLRFWRCLCAGENVCTVIQCRRCGKQRWAQLGIKFAAALAIVEDAFPRNRVTA